MIHKSSIIYSTNMTAEENEDYHCCCGVCAIPGIVIIIVASFIISESGCKAVGSLNSCRTYNYANITIKSHYVEPDCLQYYQYWCYNSYAVGSNDDMNIKCIFLANEHNANQTKALENAIIEFPTNAIIKSYYYKKIGRCYIYDPTPSKSYTGIILLSVGCFLMALSILYCIVIYICIANKIGHNRQLSINNNENNYNNNIYSNA